MVEDGACNPISRNGNVFRGFADLRADIAKRIPNGTILDGAICCLDEHGRSQFYALMSRNADCFFYAFDALRMGKCGES